MIAVAEAALIGREAEYVTDVMQSERLSMGRYVEKFEGLVGGVTKAAHVVSCCNGTAALHLALLAGGITAGDEVIVPAFAYVAVANAVRYVGATPVFCDVNYSTWNITADAVDRLVTSRTRAVIAVHTYGAPVDLFTLEMVCSKHKLLLIEDAAEAMGATFLGAPIGQHSTVATFSFYGNKIVTCGEGGALVTAHAGLAEKARLYRGQGQGARRYWHEVIGYNYRLTDLQAAVGCGQLEDLAKHLHFRQQIADMYVNDLNGLVSFQEVPVGSHHAWWMVCVLLPDGVNRDEVMGFMKMDDIETRPAFYVIPRMPAHFGASGAWHTSQELSERGLVLPTHSKLTHTDIRTVCTSLRRALARLGVPCQA